MNVEIGWERGCAVSFLGIHKSDLVCSAVRSSMTTSTAYSTHLLNNISWDSFSISKKNTYSTYRYSRDHKSLYFLSAICSQWLAKLATLVSPVAMCRILNSETCVRGGSIDTAREYLSYVYIFLNYFWSTCMWYWNLKWQTTTLFKTLGPSSSVHELLHTLL